MYPQPGETIEGKYRIEKMLGEGAMGGVFAAMHTLRRAQVALKFMSATAAALPEAVDRFMNEAISASQIESDHVVKIYDVGRWGALPYIVMEHLQGHDLQHEIETMKAARTSMPVERAVHFTLQVLRAMQVAHARGIVHRDLKPANAFVVTKDGEPDFVKLLDFGISKLRDAEAVHLTRTNVAMGTPLYMAPEQAKSARDADQRSDVYSVAAILFELLTCRPPFDADNYNLLLFKLFQEEPPHISTLRSDLPPGLAEVIHRGLAKDPNARIQSAQEFAAGLAPYSDNRSAALLARMLAQTGSGFRPSMVGGAATMVATGGYAIGGSATAGPTAETRKTSTTFGPGASSPGHEAAPKKPSKLPLIAGIAAVLTIGGLSTALVLGRAAPVHEEKKSVAAETTKTEVAKSAEQPLVESKSAPVATETATIVKSVPSVVATATAPIVATGKKPGVLTKPTTSAPNAAPTPPAEPAPPPPPPKKTLKNWTISQ